MVEAIVPVVHGGKRGRYALSVVLHVLGAGISAALLGAILGAVGGLLGAPWGVAGLVALATVALAYALRESAGLPVPIPDRHQQVPEWWRSFYSPPVSAFLYGLGLGPGFFTFLTFGTFVAVAVAAVVSGDPALGPFCARRSESRAGYRSSYRHEHIAAMTQVASSTGSNRWRPPRAPASPTP
jgi:hypothetical protein